MHGYQLRRKRHSSTKKKNLTYLVIIVLLLIFFATVGVQLVIQASLFVSGISREDTQSSNSLDNSIAVAPEISDLPDATNSAQLVIHGTGTTGTKLNIFVNDEKIDTIDMTSDEFEKDITLDPGENHISLETENTKKKIVKPSEIYTVLYLQEKPSLSISSPTDGQTVDQSELTITGKTDPDVAVRINGQPAVVSTDGSFRNNVRLKEGENLLTIIASDVAGNEEKVELKVTYQKD